MKELSLEKLENLEGGKMFGPSCSREYIGTGMCLTTCKTQFFWIRTSVDYEISAC